MTDTDTKKRHSDVTSGLVPGTFDGHTFQILMTARVWQIDVRTREALEISDNAYFAIAKLA